MQRSSEGIAVERAQWLAELAAALAAAGRLVEELGARQPLFDAIEIQSRIESARFEAQSMQLRRTSREPDRFGPEWIKSPWHEHIVAAEESPNAA